MDAKTCYQSLQEVRLLVDWIRCSLTTIRLDAATFKLLSKNSILYSLERSFIQNVAQHDFGESTMQAWPYLYLNNGSDCNLQCRIWDDNVQGNKRSHPSSFQEQARMGWPDTNRFVKYRGLLRKRGFRRERGCTFLLSSG